MGTPATGHARILDEAAGDLLFRAARTADSFTGEPVTEEQVQAVYDLVKWGPTAFNAQPLRLLQVRSAQARERLVAHMAEGNKAKTATAPLALIVTADADFHEHLPVMFPNKPGIRESMEADPARERIARHNATIQLGYLIVGIRAAGLAAGPMAGFDAEGLKKEFLGDTGQEVIAVVNVGRPGPDSFRPRNPRLEYDQAVRTV
ncbi:malonic semialdehyde reductase [Actinomadura sp. 9N407]|uniref:malonic semialdehyde reductase n=1 Tax=Actinomadura sp. 9N407 TaxID=3375154 RepID=UPI0037B3A44E